MMNIKETLKKNTAFMSAYRSFNHIKYAAATIISPTLNTKMRYKSAFKKSLDLNNPVTLNEKVLWLKLNTYFNNPLIKQCADKYKVRDYIKSIGCGEILNDLIAVYENADDIKLEDLPDQFAMKLNVGCGYNIIVSDKSKFDLNEAKKKIKKWMKEKPYLSHSEMQYKNVKPYILVEKYLKPKNGVLPEDYKFYCMNGNAPYVMLCTGRQLGGKHPHFWYYNSDWELQPFTTDALEHKTEAPTQKPQGLDKAFAYARKLSKGFPFVRVDLYIVDDKIYFGELTFTPSGGLDNGRLKVTDEILGSLVKL